MAYDKAVDSTALEQGLTKICNSVRSKSNSDQLLDFPDEISQAIDALPATIFPPNEIPDYVKAEALMVAEKVKALQTAKTITFLAVSDSHYMDGQIVAETKQINTANLHMAQAAKIIAYTTQLDFVAHMGDFAFAVISTPRDVAIRQIEELNDLLAESYPYFPQLRTVGNHDTGEYRYRQTGNPEDLTGVQELKRLVCDYNQGAVYGSRDYGYCYRDFESKKFRMISVNTCEMETTEGEDAVPTMSQAQLKWLSQTLLETGDKTGWSFAIMGHYPADFGWTIQMAHIIHAYVEGASVSVGGSSFNFSGHNEAKFVANFHGHLHNFRVGKIRDTADGNPNLTNSEFDAREICIPNSLPISNNERTKPFWGIQYHDDVTYDKTPGTAKDTAFTVNIIDPETQTVHSICYGAGYDRTIGYAATVYRSIQAVLTGCTLSNGAASVEDGQPYEADIILTDKYQIDTASVTMGGVPVEAVSGTHISIPAVTSDVIITVVASKPVTYHNLVPQSTDTDGSIYNGVGYKNDYRLSDDGAPEPYSGITTTGFMPINAAVPYVIRTGGSAKNAGVYNSFVVFYDENYKKLGFYINTRFGTSQYWGELLPKEPNAAYAWKVTPETSAGGRIGNAKYIRVCINADRDGDGLIVTINEPIE